MASTFSQGFSQSGTKLLRLSTLDDIVQAAPLWRALDARSQAPLVWFQSFDWCANWLRHHGCRRCRPLVFMLLRDGEAVAVLPLMRRINRLGVAHLCILGAPHTQYANVLTVDGKLSAHERDMLTAALNAEGGVDQIMLDLVPDSSPLFEVLPGDARVSHLNNEACQLDLASFETVAAYERSISKKSARNLRRAVNQLEQAGKVSFDVLRSNDPAFHEAVVRCLQMKAAWLANTGRISQGLEQQGHDAFLASLPSAASGDGALAFVLRLNGKAVAIELGYLQRGHYYAYIGAFDWAWRHISPGKLQMHKSMCWLIENRVSTLDLLGNPSDYKQHYATHSVKLAGFALDRSWRGAAYTALWIRFVRPGLRNMFHLMPGPWRSVLNVMRKIEYTFVA